MSIDMRRTDIFAVVAAMLTLLSCYKDLSTEATMSIPEIVVTGMPEKIDLVWGDEINLTVQVSQEGRSESDFSYLWEIDFFPSSSKERIELSDEPTVIYKVSNTPSDIPYILSLKVTDNTTGVSKICISKVYVGTSMGEGVLVAHTRDNGKTTEFDIAKDKSITYGYEDDTKYTRGLYSLANGQPLEGRVLSMVETACTNGAVFNTNKIFIGTEEHIITVDPLNFQRTGIDEELFNNTSLDNYCTTAMFNYGGYSTCAVINGVLYGMLCNIDSVLSKVAFTKSPQNIFEGGNYGYYALDQGCLLIFNSNDSRFYYLYGWMLLSSAISELDASFAFDATGAKALGGGAIKGNYPCLLMQAADGKCYVCGFDPSSSVVTPFTYPVQGTVPSNLVGVAFCDNADLLYMATESKIYSVLITGGKATVEALSWAPDSSDEKITAIRHYTQGWYGTHQYYYADYPFKLSTNRTQMLIVTYNEKTGEGKIYMRPFNVSTGRFTLKSNSTLKGFGEITAITTTFK